MNTLHQTFSYRLASAPAKKRSRQPAKKTVSVEPHDNGLVVYWPGIVPNARSHHTANQHVGLLAQSLEGLILAALVKTSTDVLANGSLNWAVASINAAREALLAERACAAVASEVRPVVRTKAAQGTIGVHSSIALRHALGDESGASFSEQARDCFVRGLGMLDERMWHEDSTVVLSDFMAAYKKFEDGDREQWSLRIPKAHYAKALGLAKEHGVSQSQLACLCLAVGLAVRG